MVTTPQASIQTSVETSVRSQDSCTSRTVSDDVFTSEGASVSPRTISSTQSEGSQKPPFGCGCGIQYTFFSFSFPNPLLLASYCHVQEHISRPHPQGGRGTVCLCAVAILDLSGLCVLHVLSVCVGSRLTQSTRNSMYSYSNDV